MKKRNNILSTVFTPCLQFVCTTSLLVIFISFLAGKAYGVTLADIGKIIFWTVECIFVLALCMEILGWGKTLSTKRLLLTSGLYAASFCVVWLSSNYLTLNFWMLGILIIGLIIPSEMAIALHIILTISYCMINGLSVETFICYFTFGTLILLLEEFLDKLKNTVAIMIIGLTTNIAFLILLHDFALNFSAEVVYQLISTGVMILCLWGIHICFDPYGCKEPRVKEELLNQLREFSETIYEHSISVGEISEGAAKQIKANADVAYAGGCYHEIGRMKGNDYISSGVEILKEHGVSQDVINVVNEHNIHRNKPTSKEAAIVMLTDSITTTIRYLKTKEPNFKITMEGLIKSIFSKRNEMGLFEQSGLSEQEIKRLKKYYIETFQGK